MKKKCKGCGAHLQDELKELEGYSKNLDNDICERCFRIKNYGDYKIINKDNNTFVDILKNINKTTDLVVLVIDIFNLPKNIKEITKYIDNDVLLVLTKKDILPLKVNDDKLLEYIDKLNIDYIDKIVISSNKNYNFDLLYKLINKYKKTNNVYVVGYTNAGKSTMINKLIYHYSDLEIEITTSILPSTTINTIEININENLKLIDTPGILDDNSIINYIDSKILKKIIPKKEIKPVTYQVKNKQFIYIDNLLIIESERNNLTLYFSNDLKKERTLNKRDIDLKEYSVKVSYNNDIVISGLGFIRVSKPELIKIYTLENVDVYVRESLI